MTPVKSRLLARLEASLAASRDPLQAACLSAERAALLARLGRFEEATAELATLRARGGSAHSPALAVWLCLADGMVEHFRHRSPSARDRLQRAYALAAAARLRPLIALSAAWLAYTDDVHDDLPALARHVAEALQEAQPDHHAARARASLVVAQGYHRGGRPDRAQPWYRQAHEHATAEGDDTLIGALLRHRAWISGTHARMASIFGADRFPVDAMALRHAQMSAESAEHFDAHAGHTGQRPLGPSLRAQLLAAQGRYDEALVALQARLEEDSLAATGNPTRAALLADLAWCLVQRGRRDEALVRARDVEASFPREDDPEDRAAAHGRLRQVFAALGLAADAGTHAECAEGELAALRERQARLVQLLDQALRHVSDAPRTPVRA